MILKKNEFFVSLGFDKVVEDLINKCHADNAIQNKNNETSLLVAVKEGKFESKLSRNRRKK